MSHEPHQLLEEFPDKAEKILRLKVSDTKFAQLFNDYHKLNHEIVEAEANVHPTADEILEDMKKKRLKMLDTFADLLR
jgi:hypothetical protein